MVKCPNCQDGKVFAFANNGLDYTKHTQGIRDCDTCNGTGQITLGKMALINEGKLFRKTRVALNMTTGELADELGIKTSTLSALECGRTVADHVKQMVIEELGLEEHFS